MRSSNKLAWLLLGCLYGLLGTGAASVFAQKHVLEREPLPATEQLAKFELPPGFEIQLVASEPEIAKPINMNFDAAGRLLVSQSVEYPYPAKENPRDAVLRLTIDPATGKANRIETIIAGLNIPIGVTPIGREVIVYTVGEILRCADKDGDGTFEDRQTLYSGFGYEDTHGMNNGFNRWLDGWVYANHGFRNQSHTAGADGQKLNMQSGNTYRFRDDGSHIEQYTWGQVNPFGNCFDTLGNLFTADCHSRPAYLLLRGAYYPSFGKPHDGLGYGPEMMTHSHGSTGIAGVIRYEADHFPPEYRGRLFIGNPITAKINADELQVHGSTYVAIEQSDFLTCDDPWCRPVDIKLGPDGALYFADFYNRIIGHYEVPLDHPGRDRRRGRIWRIVYRGTEGNEQPAPELVDQTKADISTLIQNLSNPNICIRIHAVHELVDRKLNSTSIPPLLNQLAYEQQGHLAQVGALWALERTGALNDAHVTHLAKNPLREVRVNLWKMMANRAEWTPEQAEFARVALIDEDAFVRRAAAEAIGLHLALENVSPLIAAWQSTAADDTMFIHTARIAVRNHLRSDAILNAPQLKELAAGEFQPQLLNVLLGTATPAAANFILHSIPLDKSNPASQGVEFLVRHIDDSQLPRALEKVRKDFKSVAPREVAEILSAVRRAMGERGQPLATADLAWAVKTAETLLSEPATQRRGMELARDLALKEVYSRVASFVIPAAGESKELQSLAIDACVAMDAEKIAPVVATMLANAQQELPLRQKCALILGQVNSEAAQQTLLDSLKIAPEPVALAIAIALASQATGGEKLLDAVAAGQASGRLLQDRNVANVLIDAQVHDARARIAALTAQLPPSDDRIAQLIKTRLNKFNQSPGNAARGLAVFKKTCAACHRLENIGNKIGPELDGIGHRGVLRVMEDVLDPSRNVDGAFRTTVLATSDGRTIAGLLLREEGATLILADNRGQEIRVASADVEERTVSPLSPMPGNVAEIVSEADFHDLIAFLLSQQKPIER
jgi:putative heme-binding domain-containing protein